VDADCANEDFCDGAETCVDGACQDGMPPCAEDEMCNEDLDRCDECETNEECDDGAFCNGAETCTDGQCANGVAPCAVGEFCNEPEDSCDECAADGDCDDGAFCNGTETCVDGACAAGTDPCVEGEVCDEANDECRAPDCDEDADCDDGVFCNGAETCDGGLCMDGAEPCAEGDVCDEENAECVEIQCDEDGDCPEDGNNCTEELCQDGLCVTEDVVCEEGETCDPATGNCVTDTCDSDEDCDDGEFCNGLETCSLETGECLAGSRPCDDTDVDGNVLTCDQGAAESCDEGDTEAVCTPCPPETLDLTLDADNLVGTTGDDSFNGPLTFNPGTGLQVATLQTGDRLRGLAGDDLLTSQHNGTLLVPTEISGIEIFDTTAFAATTFNCSNVSGVDDLNTVNSTATLSYTGLQELANCGLFNITDAAVGLNLTFANATITGGTTDTLTATLSAANAGTLNVTNVGTNGFETLAFMCEGASANTLANFTQTNGTSLTTATFAGGTNTTVQVLPNTIRTHTATDMTGNLTLGTGTSTADYATFATANFTSLMGGSGDDTIIFGTTLNASDYTGSSPDLGAGTDVVQATLASAYVPAMPFLGVEEWRINATAAASINLIGQTGVTTLTNEADGAATALQFQNVAATSSVFPTLQFRGNNTQAAQTYDTVTYTAVGNTGASDSLTINVNNRGTALNATGTTNVHTIGGGTLTAAGFENVTVNVTDGPATFSGLTVSTLTTLTVTGSSNVTLGQVDATGSTIVQVTATGVSGNFSATLDEMGTGASISCGGGNDTIVIGANSTGTSSSVNLGDGNDTYTGDTDTDSDDVINAGAGSDIINAGPGNDTVTTGSGSDIVIYDQFTAGDETDITDFTAGAGGDVMRFDISALGLAGGDEYVGVIGGLAVNSSEEIVILTGVGYATDELAEDAVAARVTTDGLDMVIIYFNTATATTHICQDPDAGVDGAGTIKLLGNLTNITTQADHDTLTIANIDSQA
jgi:hypothetical protein